jgi:predicted carbohydrate-binding protein with CBM5 and CBM33 domain
MNTHLWQRSSIMQGFRHEQLALLVSRLVVALFVLVAAASAFGLVGTPQDMTASRPTDCEAVSSC